MRRNEDAVSEAEDEAARCSEKSGQLRILKGRVVAIEFGHRAVAILTVVVLPTICRAATLTGELLTADVTNIVIDARRSYLEARTLNSGRCGR